MIKIKLTQDQIEKVAFFPGLAAAAGHVLSNVGLKKMIMNPRTGKELGRSFAENAFNKKAPSASYVLPAAAGFAPELEIGMSHISDMASDIATNKKYKGLRKYYDVLKSKTPEEIQQWQSMPKARRQNRNIINRLSKDKGFFGGLVTKHSPISKALTSKNPIVRKSVMNDLIDVKNRYGLTKNIIPSTIDRTKELTESKDGMKNIIPKKRIAPSIISSASIGATALIDPITAGWSGFKKIISSKVLSKSPITSKPQKKLQDVFLNNRSRKLYEMGVSGKEIPMRKTKQFADTYLMNPITAEIKNMSYDIGSLNRKYQNTPKLI